MLKQTSKGVACAVLMAAAGSAMAQPTPAACGSGTGPDVIVGIITGPTNYTAVGTREAVSFGTTSCNMGTTALHWDASPANTHPVIGGNLYKWSTVNGATRFEQIGLSWLKHGFLALANSDCCTCQNPGTGALLGVGCSDPYTSSRNGTQSGLGPRNTVNAHTGAYPTGTPTRPSGGNLGRCEVEIADLEASSATVKYVGECQYVTPDDAAAGRQNNNASRIDVTASGSGTTWTFGFSGTTTRQESAIWRWRGFDPTVTMNYVQVPDDGMYVVGSKATDLGGGQWHYEYAVYNMNGDRNGGSFGIPVPAGVTVSNIGFHGVVHRDGSGSGAIPYSTAAWSTTESGGMLTFACETPAANPNANAIRWGTTYNFRFDTNSPPASGSNNVTLGLWKNGTVPSVQVGAVVPSCGVAAGFSAHPSASTVCPGDNATFSATATGTNPAHQWQRETSPGVYASIGNGAIAGLGTVSGATTGTLTITGVEAGATSNFRDTASNGCGTASGNPASLTVRPANDPLCGGLVCDNTDFNGDTLQPDTADIDDFLSVFSGGPCSTGNCGDIDFNNDSLYPDTGDIDALLSVFSGGPCL